MGPNLPHSYYCFPPKTNLQAGKVLIFLRFLQRCTALEYNYRPSTTIHYARPCGFPAVYEACGLCPGNALAKQRYHPAAHKGVPRCCCLSGAWESSTCRLGPAPVQLTGPTPIPFGKAFERPKGARPPLFPASSWKESALYINNCNVAKEQSSPCAHPSRVQVKEELLPFSESSVGNV